MNKTYNNDFRNIKDYSRSYITVCEKSFLEKILELFSIIFNITCDFVTNEAVVLVSKLAICSVCFIGMFILMGLSIGGSLPFLSAFLTASGLLGVIILIFRSII
ncbi:MAG: hypothetical protein IJZ89_07305 [Clostridia bacterium]|nr:hypothetical protein [Clostridia bacterium]